MKKVNFTHRTLSLELKANKSENVADHSYTFRNSSTHILISTFLMALTFVLISCGSFSVLKPGDNATVVSPVPVDVYWDVNLQPGSIKIILDAASSPSDVTSQFAIPSTSANSHATALLYLSQGPHTIDVSGNLSISGSYRTRSTSRSFLVSNGAGRPVTYTETVFNYTPGWPSGKLGNLNFGGTSEHPNVNLIFTFEGNTHDVVPFNVKTTKRAVNDGVGWEILAGTASVTVQDAQTMQTLAQGTFVPGARVFVSVDNGNRGIGFGSFGGLPSDSPFPPPNFEPVYPYAQFLAPPTDLVSNYKASADWALSCAGFAGAPGTPGPGNCNLPLPLGTTAGILIINCNNVAQPTAPPGVIGARFTTVVH